MNEIDRLIFQMKVEAREKFRILNHINGQLREIETQAGRLGMKLCHEKQELVPLVTEKETIIKQLKQSNG